MNIAPVLSEGLPKPEILGVPFEPVDRPFIDYWRSKIPHDFEENNAVKQNWLQFELGGIERGKALLARLAKHIAIRDKAVLDIGAGNGGMCIAAALSGAREVYGLEVQDFRIDLALYWAACRGVHVDIRQGVAESLPFADSSMDLVILWAVIEHVDNPEKAIEEMARVLRPGGCAVINAPNRLSPRWFLSDPHYQTIAVSALPRSIAKWWVTKVRKISPNYTVGIFPIYSTFVRKLRRRGFQLVHEEHQQYLIERLERPELIQSALRLPVELLAKVGLNRLAAAMLRNTSALFEVVVKKTA